MGIILRGHASFSALAQGLHGRAGFEAAPASENSLQIAPNLFLQSFSGFNRP